MKLETRFTLQKGEAAMSRTKTKPVYSLHKASGQARVRIDGKDHYLGSYGSQESRERYEDLVDEWFARNGDTTRYMLTVDKLALLYVDFADGYYRKNGKPTGEHQNIKLALRHAVKLYGTSRVREFGPLKLKKVRQSMIDAGLCRTSINRHVSRVKAMFKWAVENEYLPVEVYQALATVRGLQKGRTEAKEADPVTAVADALIQAVRPYVTQPVWGMIQLQRLTGMRPGEVTAIRGRDLNMMGKVWEYIPESHKTEHHGKRRIIFIGPKAQQIVREYLKPNLQEYLFSPKDGRAEFVELNYPKSSKPKRDGKRKPGNHYSVYTYHGAVRRACLKAGIPHWHPNQLRHSAATAIRRGADIDTARTVLGHSSVAITEVYAEQDFETARRIIAKIG